MKNILVFSQMMKTTCVALIQVSFKKYKKKYKIISDQIFYDYHCHFKSKFSSL